MTTCTVCIVLSFGECSDIGYDSTDRTRLSITLNAVLPKGRACYNVTMKEDKITVPPDSRIASHPPELRRVEVDLSNRRQR